MIHYDWLYILVLTFNFSECSTGIYGVNCESRRDTCANRICDRFDGRCKYGCIEGFKGDRGNLSVITTLLKGGGSVIFAMNICKQFLIA